VLFWLFLRNAESITYMLSTRTGGSSPSPATMNANAFQAAAFSIAAIRIVLGLGI